MNPEQLFNLPPDEYMAACWEHWVGANYYPASPPSKSVTLLKEVELGTCLFEHPAPSAPEDQIAEIKRKERERCAAMLENGRFLHDQAPTKLFATEAAKAIREMKKEMK